MSKRPSNYGYNYSRVIDWLDKNEIEYIEYNGGQHLRILGDVSLVDLWPSRMTCHIIESESSQAGYKRLDFKFNPKQLEAVLNGEASISTLREGL